MPRQISVLVGSVPTPVGSAHVRTLLDSVDADSALLRTGNEYDRAVSDLVNVPTSVGQQVGSRLDRVVVDTVNATAAVPKTTLTTSSAQPLFAGHVPGRVMVGMAASGGNPPPEWSEARTIIRTRSQQVLGVQGAGAYEWRKFIGTQVTGSASNLNELQGMLNEIDAVGVYPWISSKVVGNDWAGVAAGNYPAIPAMWRQLAINRRNSGKGPFMATMHHEPRGDAPAGQDLSDWSAMHVYMSNQLADVNDIMAWSAIGNGFLWNQVNPTGALLTDRNQTFSQTLIDTFRINKHVVAVDTYDDGYPAYTGQETVPTGLNVRVSVKLKHFIDYMRARNSGALGVGEWSALDGPEMPKVWQVYYDNRDIFAISNYFNSLQNSQWDWRLIPANYPDNNATALDYGGTALTDARLTEFVRILELSKTVG